MKKIEIKALSLTQFKGIKSLNIEFNGLTNIYGANGTGKTTVFDAFTYLLFGKDSSERKDFNVKTLDVFGKSQPMIECEVSAVLLVDGEILTIKRVLKENWVKKRGNEESEFKGNETLLYWNEVPMLVSDFNTKLGGLINELVFKIITSPTFFTSMDWKKQRSILIEFVGEISDSELAKGNAAYEALVANLTQGKTLEDYQKQIKASISKAKEDLKQIPARRDEVTRSKPESKDFTALEAKLSVKQSELVKIDSELTDVNKGFQSKLDAQLEAKVKVNNLKAELQTIESEARKETQQRLKPNTTVLDGLVSEKSKKEGELSSYTNLVSTLESTKSAKEQEIVSLTKKMDDKRAEWNTENAKEISFNDNDFHCPTCKRDFESGDVESKKAELTATFKSNKSAKLAELQSSGLAFKSQKENIEVEVITLTTRIENGKMEIAKATSEVKSIVDKIDIENSSNSSGVESISEETVYESILALDNKYQEKLLSLQVDESLIVEITSTDNPELVAKRSTIVSEIDQIKSELALKSEIEKADLRLEQLKKEETELSQQIANVEKTQFTIDNFIKDKIERLEHAINSRFKFVKFKMFNAQINGALTETCEAMVNGVPYSDVNTASKINAGLDIINTLSEFYQISAPVFVDNRESVTEILETESQIISLIVSPENKVLKVESVAKEMVA